MLHNALDTAVFNISMSELLNVAGNVAIVIPGVTNARSELVLVSFTLTTDATVVNRVLYIELQHPAITMNLAFSGITTPGSQVRRFLFGKGLPTIINATNDVHKAALPNDIYLLEGWNINVHLEGGVAGDVMSAIRTYFRVWTYEQ